MVAWYWVLIAGSLGAILGFFLFCVFAVGNQEPEPPKKSSSEAKKPDNWY